MKRWLTILLTALLLLSLSACSDSGSPNNSTPDNNNAATSDTAEAQDAVFADYITVVVPFDAGSNTDMQMRLVQSYLESQLGVSVVVENVGGASGIIGTTDFINRNDTTGNTILFTLPTPTVYKPLTGDTTYTYAENLQAVAQVSAAPMYLVVGEDSQFETAQDVLDYMTNNPGQFTFAHAGNGGIAHLAFASFISAEGFEAISVPYAGGTAECYTAVMGGEVMAYICGEQDVAGRTGVKAVINLGDPSTSPDYADIPTLADLGYTGYSINNFSAFYYVKGVDSTALAAFEAAVAGIMEDAAFLEAADTAGLTINHSEGVALDKRILDTIDAVLPVMQDMGLAAK